MQAETHKRSIAKTISWRVIATLIALSVVYIVTGEPRVTLEAAGAVAVINTIGYYLHERAWGHVSWGRARR